MGPEGKRAVFSEERVRDPRSARARESITRSRFRENSLPAETRVASRTIRR